MSNIKKILLLSCLILLTGCGQTYDQFIERQAEKLTENQASESVASESETESATVDERIIPEFNQLEKALLESDKMTLDPDRLSIDEASQRTSQDVITTVESVHIWDVTEANPDLKAAFHYEEEPGAIVLLNVTIANQSNQAIQVIPNNFHLNYLDGVQMAYPNDELYPLPNGNLSKIMQGAEYVIPQDAHVEGYLAFGIGEEMYQMMQEVGYFTLNTEFSPQNQQNVGDAVEAKIPMPLNEEMAQAIQNNEQMLNDRITNEWWGNKALLAEAEPNETQEDEDVSVTLNAIQVTDFEPFENYESVFQNFLSGQIIVTAEFTVKNNTEETILPLDGDISLTINGDEIYDDYMLINQMYGERLEPGEEMTVVRSFALDKRRYADYWQDEEILIQMNIPTLAAVEEAEQAEETDEAAEESIEESEANDEESMDAEETKPLFYFTWSYQPDLLEWINEDLERVDVPEEEDDESENSMSAASEEADSENEILIEEEDVSEE